jgi:hypothetical protein
MRARGLRTAEKINHPFHLSFGPSIALKKDLHTTSMRTFFNAIDEPKSGVIWTIYLFYGP